MVGSGLDGEEIVSRRIDSVTLPPNYAKAHGLKPRLCVVAMANMGCSPMRMQNAPVPAVR
jgi:acetyl-CoA acetyltransferase